MIQLCFKAPVEVFEKRSMLLFNVRVRVGNNKATLQGRTLRSWVFPYTRTASIDSSRKYCRLNRLRERLDSPSHSTRETKLDYGW